MRKILLGTVGLAAMLASPAMAADMRVPPPPPPVVYYDWTGAYVGANIGAIWSTVDQTFPNPQLLGGVGPGSLGNVSTSPNSGILGFHAGAQWQWGAWVLGVEAALSGCFNECREVSGIIPGALPPGGIAPAGTTSTQFEHKITNLFTVGPRIGYAWDRWMVFATGGWASANLKAAQCFTNVLATANNAPGPCDGPSPGSRFSGASQNNNGYYIGGGFDYMVHKGPLVDVILGVEYQHYDVRSHNAFCFNPGCGAPTGWDYDLAAKGDIVRARFTIKSHAWSFLY
jgi:outer membrane immunogenic protein